MDRGGEIRCITSSPSTRACLSAPLQVLVAIRTSLKEICAEAGKPDATAEVTTGTASAAAAASVGLSLPLRLVARAARLLPKPAPPAGAPAATYGQLEWSRVLEDIIRWAAPPPVAGATAAAAGGGSGGSGLAASAAGGDGTAAFAGATPVLVPLLLGLPAPRVSPALGSDAETLCGIVAAMPPRVRVDLLVGQLGIDGSNTSHDAKAISDLNALLNGGSVGGAPAPAAAAVAALYNGTHVLYMPPFFPQLKSLMDANAAEAALANVGAAASGEGAVAAAAAKKRSEAAGSPPTGVVWKDAQGQMVAWLLFQVLYEAVVRISDGPLSEAPGLAALFNATVAKPAAASAAASAAVIPVGGARCLSNPASVIWSFRRQAVCEYSQVCSEGVHIG